MVQTIRLSSSADAELAATTQNVPNCALLEYSRVFGWCDPLGYCKGPRTAPLVKFQPLEAVWLA